MVAKRLVAGKAVNPVGLGCMSLSWAYGTPPGDDYGAQLLNRALDLGYGHLDTANIYGLGHNETLLGQALKGRRDEFFLATKMGIVADGPAEVEGRVGLRTRAVPTIREEPLGTHGSAVDTTAGEDSHLPAT